MSEETTWILRREHMLKAISAIQGFTSDMSYAEFLEDDKTRYAVERNFEILGEACKHIPDDVREAYPDVPWQKVRGLRNIVSHNYNDIEYDTIWEIIQDHLPSLKEQLESMDLGKG